MLLGFGLAGLFLPSLASAATITVNTTADEFASGARCSLREAVWAANNDSNAQAPGCRTGSGTDLIQLPSGQFNLTRAATPPASSDENAGLFGDLDVTAPVSIVHTGFEPAAISQNVSGERVIQNLAGGSGLALQSVAIRYGFGSLGGGLLNQGNLSVVASTIVSNNADSGGGVANTAGSASFVNSTISGNSANQDGGGIWVGGGTVSLRSTTVSGNSVNGDGAGAFVFSTGPPSTLQLRDTLLAGNGALGGGANDCAHIGGKITSQGHNLVGNTNGCGYQKGPGDIRNRSAQIIGLGDFGGPTPTVNLKKTSPAIGHGTGCPATDQRGVPRNLGAPCDIGGWELVRCQGVVVNTVGTNGPELLVGTFGPDGILALGGSDTVRALGGNDGLCGGGGSDRLEGGGGNDHTDGGPGTDTCLGGGGSNTAVNCERPRQRR